MQGASALGLALVLIIIVCRQDAQQGLNSRLWMFYMQYTDIHAKKAGSLRYKSSLLEVHRMTMHHNAC